MAGYENPLSLPEDPAFYVSAFQSMKRRRFIFRDLTLIERIGSLLHEHTAADGDVSVSVALGAALGTGDLDAALVLSGRLMRPTDDQPLKASSTFHQSLAGEFVAKGDSSPVDQ